MGVYIYESRAGNPSTQVYAFSALLLDCLVYLAGSGNPALANDDITRVPTVPSPIYDTAVLQYSIKRRSSLLVLISSGDGMLRGSAESVCSLAR